MSDLSDNLFDGDGGDTDADDGAPSGDLSTASKDPKSTDKRVSDLQSKADKETARANKAEARLKALQVAMEDKGAETGSAPPASAAGDLGGAILDMARMFAVQQNPKLAEFGLSSADLTGSTPSEIAQSAAALIARFDKIETQIRNKVLADNGLTPDISAGTPPDPKRDYSKMGAEDFKKVVDAALNR
jgi:type III secretion system FlhB-like substrate exporter